MVKLFHDFKDSVIGRSLLFLFACVLITLYASGCPMRVSTTYGHYEIREKVGPDGILQRTKVCVDGGPYNCLIGTVVEIEMGGGPT